MKPLTDKQRKVLSFIGDFLDENGYSPTMRTIASHFKWASANSAREHCLAIESKGWLKKTPRGYIVAEGQ